MADIRFTTTSGQQAVLTEAAVEEFKLSLRGE